MINSVELFFKEYTKISPLFWFAHLDLLAMEEALACAQNCLYMNPSYGRVHTEETLLYVFECLPPGNMKLLVTKFLSQQTFWFCLHVMG